MENKEDNNRFREIKTTLIFILVLNWIVSLAKIMLGMLTRCASITADGFHSLSDGASNIIGLIGIRVASQPSDKDHPYGHKKYETFFSLGIAAMLFIVSFELFQAAIARLRTPEVPQIDSKSFAVMIMTLAVNLVVILYETKKGKKLQSDILISDAMHTKADIFISLSVIFALVVIKLGLPLIDPLVSMLIALFIVYSGLKIAMASSRVLCDKAVIIEDKRIADIVLKIKGVRTCHKIRTRGRTDDIHVDLHVQVKPHMHIEDAHKICDSIEEALKKEIPGVTDVVVHIEPQENT
jgi:cation diffusion facilitator family transporter